MLVEAMVSDLRARVAWVHWCKRTGCATEEVPPGKQLHVLNGETYLIVPTYPCGPCAKKRPTWLLPTFIWWTNSKFEILHGKLQLR